MVKPETDIALINRIANDPKVLPFIRMDGEPMDFSLFEGKRITETGVVILSNGEDAIGLFAMTHPGIYQAHTLFGGTCRGRKAIETAREMLGWMFSHNAHTIWGDTPRANRPAVLFNRLVGAKVIGGDEDNVIFEYKAAA